MCGSCDAAPGGAQIVIEYPSAGSTYRNEEYGVYMYDEYPAGSVNEGLERRRFIDSDEKLEDIQARHPRAEWGGNGSGFAEHPLPANSPAWFDPAHAGESWDGN